MGSCSHEYTDISESEMEEYMEITYEDLKKGKEILRVSDDRFTCPYCPLKKREYLYLDLYQHASNIARGNSKNRSARERANHCGLTKYLEEYISEFETKDYDEKTYEDLVKGKNIFQVSDEGFICPYCPSKKRNRDYLYKELLQHAVGIGACNSKSRSAKEKANHRVLTKYLKNHARDLASPSQQMISLSCDQDELFVWPWTVIMVNLPTLADAHYVGESGIGLSNELRLSRFDPKWVHPLWSCEGYSVVIKFDKDWLGLNNALSFGKTYDLDNHGKKDWLANGSVKSGTYAWIARMDEYNSPGIIGEHLKKTSVLTTIAYQVAEENRKTNITIISLTNILKCKSKSLKENEQRYIEVSSSLNKMIAEQGKLHHAYDEDMRKIHASARNYHQKLFQNHEKLKMRLESEMRDLNLRELELKKSETCNETQRKRLLEDTGKRNCCFHHAAVMPQHTGDGNMLKLAEEQKREIENLQKRVTELKKQLKAKQKLEQEIEQYQLTLNAAKRVGGENYLEFIEKADNLMDELSEKEGQINEMDSLNQTLIVKEHRINEELQGARIELINGLLETSSSSSCISVKRLGQLDTAPFYEACKRKYPEEVAEDAAAEISSMWEEHLRDPQWHPFKVIKINGQSEYKEIINEEDEKLKGLKTEWGNDPYMAVTGALTHINEYNPSGRYVINELWNKEEGRKASLQEGVASLMDKWKAHKGMTRGR